MLPEARGVGVVGTVSSVDTVEFDTDVSPVRTAVDLSGDVGILEVQARLGGREDGIHLTDERGGVVDDVSFSDSLVGFGVSQASLSESITDVPNDLLGGSSVLVEDLEEVVEVDFGFEGKALLGNSGDDGSSLSFNEGLLN